MSAQSGDFLIPQLRELESELDEERKARVNAVTLKKKIETDMKDLEEQLEAANRVKEDGLRQLKKYQQQVKDIQRDLDEARQARDEISEQAKENERKAKQLEADYVQMQEVSEQFKGSESPGLYWGYLTIIPSASWAIDPEAVRARGIIMLVKPN